MAPKLVVATQPSDPIELIQDLAPAGLDLTIAQFGSPEYRNAMKQADFSVGFPDPGLNDAFFESLPKAVHAQIHFLVYKKSMFSQEIAVYTRETQQHCSFRAASEIHEVMLKTRRLLRERRHLLVQTRMRSPGKSCTCIAGRINYCIVDILFLR